MKFNEQQQQALSHHAGALLVSAGAGSGKTAVLTEAAAQAVRQGVQVANMLVVTYTNAAAAEMKHRIEVRLRELALSPELDGEEKARVRQGVLELPGAQISTLHAFCAQVLRRNFQAVGLDPAFRVADEFESAALLRAAAEEAIAAAVERGEPGFFALQEGFGGRQGKALVELVLAGMSFLNTLPEPEAYLERARRQGEILPEEVQNSPAAKKITSAFAARAARAAKLLAQCGEELPPGGEFDALRQMFGAEREELLGIAKALRQGGPLAAAAGFSYGRLNFPRKVQAPKERIKALRESAKAAFDLKKLEAALTLCDGEEQARRMALEQPQIDALCGLLLAARAIAAREKAERGVIDFADMEHLALKALSDPGVAAEYRARFSIIFVDEYQDSSALQEALLNKISDGSNLFCVGDVKQSIYSFRAARPALFLARAAAAAQGKGEVVHLNVNYRTEPCILGCVNDVFSYAMQGEIVYGEEDALQPGRLPSAGERPVSVYVLDKNANEEEDEAPLPEALLTDAENEALLCAALIKERLGRPLPSGKIATYSDFAVLLRTTAGASEVYARVFAAEGIPAFADLTGGYFEALEVQVFLNLLRLCDNKRQDVALLSVLRAGIGGFTDAEIAQVRIRAGKHRPEEEGTDPLWEEAGDPEEGEFTGLSSERREEPYSYCEAFCDVAAGEDGLAKKCAAFLALLDEARQEARLLPLSRFVEWLAVRTGYADSLRAQRGSAARLANLNAFFARARAYEAVSPRGLPGFLTYLDDALRAGRDLGSARTVGGGECVRILSVHRSKGLEFPVVFLCGAGRRFNLTDSRRRVVWSESLGVCMKYYDPQSRTLYPTLFHAAAAESARQSAIEEELRVLYVALTRARDELAVVGTVKNAAKEALRWQNTAGRDPKAPLDWIMAACARFAEASGFFAGLGCFPRAAATSGGWWEFHLCGVQAGRQAAGGMAKGSYEAFRQQALRADPAPFLKNLRPRRAQAMLPAKLAATAFSGAQAAEPLRPTPRFLGETALGGAAVGSATHLLLRHLDLTRPLDAGGLRKQARALADAGFMTAQESAAALTAELAEFFESPLGARLKQAKGLLREKPFSLRLLASELPGGHEGQDWVVVQGIIDACFLEDGGWVLLDYKTDMVFGSPKEAAEAHRPQLTLYARALQEGTGRPVKEGYVCLLRAGAAVRLI